MFKKYRILKWSLLILTSIIAFLVIFGFWFMSLLPPSQLRENLPLTQVADLPYLTDDIPPSRGKILAVVTSTSNMGASGKSTGYELAELARAYYVFQANGFEVDIASPLGETAPVVIDNDDMGHYEYAFMNDDIAQSKTAHTIAIDKVRKEEYSAVFFTGGKGAMFDFPENTAIQDIIREFYQSNKVVGAVCHGPAALVNVTLDNGRPLVENVNVSGFTNEEELLLIPDAETIFPFLLQDKLVAQGARFNEGTMYLEKISHDNNLITGQNPWSTWVLAEAMISQLGYVPKPRAATGDENAVEVLGVYHAEGSEKAKELMELMIIHEQKPLNRALIASHSLIAAMKGELGHFSRMIGLVSYAKKCQGI